ncbi:MAG: HAD family phosphatase [Calditrichaeota bacterium]|nr:HAD family phosphatase [Calditrichota bacterium]
MHLFKKVNELKAVILDMDGVLVDTEPTHMDAFDIFLKNYDLPSNPHILEGFIGFSVEENLRMLQEKHAILQNKSHQELVDERNKIFIDMLAEGVHPMPGIVELLKLALHKKLKIALATSSDHNHADIVLKGLTANPEYELNFPAVFDCIVGGDDVPAKKPAPFIYQKALKELGIKAENAFAIEDSVTGVKSAKGAGIYCFALRNPYVNFNENSGQDEIIDSIMDVVSGLASAL